MITLFIDTSSTDVSIALIKDNNILSEICETLPNQHSIYTTSYLDKVLKTANIEPNEVDKIMIVNGPGSFTGVRIGVTIAKTFAYILKKDIICLSSLKIKALSTNHDYCLSLINANRGNYYIGLYDKDNNEVIEEQFNTKEEVIKLIDKYNPTIVSDNNIETEEFSSSKTKLDLISIVNYYKDYPSINPHLVVPNYLKLPQALEEKK